MFGGVEIDDVVRAGALGSSHRVYFYAAVAFDLRGDYGCQFLGCAIHGAPLSWFGICSTGTLPVRRVCATAAKGAQARVRPAGVNLCYQDSTTEMDSASGLPMELSSSARASRPIARDADE